MTFASDIKTGLLARAEILVQALALEAAMPNVPFTPPTDKVRWLEVLHFPNTNIDPTWDNHTIGQGFLQINVVDPMLEGEILPLAICDQIVAFFDKGTVIRQGVVVVKIEAQPSVLSAIQDGHKATFPVSIPYRAYS